MLVGHTFDFALVLRSRRRSLRLRQADLAKHLGLSRSFISDLEHGKPSIEFGKVLKVMAALNIPLSIGWEVEQPDWAKPIIKRVRARERRCLAARPAGFRGKERPDPKPPRDWFEQDAAEAKAWLARREEEARFWSKEEVDRYVLGQTAKLKMVPLRPERTPEEALHAARRSIVALIAARSFSRLREEELCAGTADDADVSD